MSARIGSLFSGYGGLDLGVQSVVGGSVGWHVEFDAAPSRILEHRFPGVPNYGDITTVDWSAVEPVDVLTGGFPCQDVSLAGLRRGLKEGTRSGLWSEFARAIDVLRPGLVVIENVRGLLSAEASGVVESDAWDLGDGSNRPALRALGAVLGDLAELGYDTRWGGFRAADAGAPHGRFRVFVVARPADSDRGRRGQRHARLGVVPVAHTLGSEPATDTAGRGRDGRAQDEVGETVERAATAGGGFGVGTTANAVRDGGERPGAAGDVAGTTRLERIEEDRRDEGGDAFDHREHSALAWGAFEAAIRRWEHVARRVAPAPTELAETYVKMVRRRLAGKDPRPVGMRGSLAPRASLSPAFVEWMMGLPSGWVTDPVIGLTRNEQLKALGNGVVPQQAALAVRSLLEAEAAAA